MSDNVALMRQALKTFTSAATIHLGDVYYSGTASECQTNILDVLDGLIAELKIARPPFFTIPGNHDYYSGGAGFFGTIDQVNKSLLPKYQQKASYFCLRTRTTIGNSSAWTPASTTAIRSTIWRHRWKNPM